jgi:peroxin-3
LTPLTDNFPHPSISASTSASALRRLIDEASDLIDSPTATHVLTLLLDALFSHLTDQVLLSQAFKLPLSAGETAPRVQEIPDDPSANPADPIQAKAKLANILAVVTRQAHAIGSGVPNEYVQAMEEVREVEAFAAVVYSCNWEFEGIGKTMEGQATGESGTTEAPAEAVESAQEASGGLVHATWGLLESVWGRVAGT